MTVAAAKAKFRAKRAKKATPKSNCGQLKAQRDAVDAKIKQIEQRNEARKKAKAGKLATRQKKEAADLAARQERELRALDTEYGCTPHVKKKRAKAATKRPPPPGPAAAPPAPAGPADLVIGEFRATWDGPNGRIALYSPFVDDDQARAAKGAMLQAAGFEWHAAKHRWERLASSEAWAAGKRALRELAKTPAWSGAPPPSGGRFYGNQTSVALTSARGALQVLPARFVLMSAAKLVPSHDSQTFEPRLDYPGGVQERRYEADRGEQLKVIGVAQDMQPGLLQSTSTGAVDGTPVVAAGDVAIVLGGNGRTMGAQRHYLAGKNELRDYVREHAPEFGFTRAQAESIADPIVVRVVDQPRNTWPRLVRDLNVALTQAMDATTEAAAQARQLPPDVLRTLADGLGDGELGDFLGSRASLPLVGALERSGFINRSNRGRMLVDSGLLSPEARGQLERQLLALLVPDADLLERLGPELRRTLGRSAPTWLAAGAAGPDWDIRAPLHVALGELRALRHSGECLAKWLQQGSIAGEPTTKPDTMARLLLEIFDLAGGKPAVLHRIARAYFQAGNGGGLFGAASPMQALQDAALGAGIKPESAMSRHRCRRAA